jgi:hypothetical protein
LLEATRRVFREDFSASSKAGQEFRHILGSRETAAIEIISPPERHRAALPGEAVKLNCLKGKTSMLRSNVLSSSWLRKSA